MPKGVIKGEIHVGPTKQEQKTIQQKEQVSTGAMGVPAPRPQGSKPKPQLSTAAIQQSVQAKSRTVLDVRTPPQDLDAEQAVLGSILIDNDQFMPVRKIISQDKFYKQAHRVIFEVMETLYDDLKPMDLVAMTDELRKLNQLDSVGSVPYLIGLMDTTPTAAYAEYYADIVREKAVLRDIISASGAIMQSAYDQQDTQQILPKATQAFTTLVLGERREGEMLERTLTRVENHALGYSVIRTGYPTLDNMIGGLPADDLTIIAARTSQGKGIVATSFSKNIADEAQTREPKAFVMYFSPDQSAEKILQLEVAKQIGVANDLFVKKDKYGARRVTPQQVQAYRDATRNLKKTFLRQVKVRAGGLPIDVLKQEALVALEEGACMILIDTIQKVAPYRGKTMQRREIVEEVSGWAKTIGIEYNVPVVAMSQVAREVEQRELNDFPGRRPLKSDLAIAPGELANDAGMILMLYNEQKYIPNPNTRVASMQICVAKDKAGDGGTWENNAIGLGIQKEYAHLYDPSDLSTMIQEWV